MAAGKRRCSRSTLLLFAKAWQSPSSAHLINAQNLIMGKIHLLISFSLVKIWSVRSTANTLAWAMLAVDWMSCQNSNVAWPQRRRFNVPEGENIYGSRPKTPERFLVKDLFSHFSHGLKPASRKFRARAAQGTRKYYCYHYYKYYF